MYFFWRWGYVVTDPTAKQPAEIPPHRRLPSFFGPDDYFFPLRVDIFVR
jgi:hypothetical protein